MLKKYLSSISFQNKKLLAILTVFIISFPTWSYTEKVYSGIKELSISDNLSLKIISYFNKDCDLEEELCLPSNKLFLIKGSAEYDYSKLIEFWNEDTFVYFVKTSKEGYLNDLDGDGTQEVAIYPMIAGNNPITDVYIYSIVSNSLKFYGMGRFHYERGPYVFEMVKGKWVEPNP